MSVRLEGPEDAARYRALSAAVDRHCPVTDVLARPVEIRREITLGPAPA